jgi:tryptophan synthase alpha subunit
MIPFKMQILSYNPVGSYSVEYLPENEKCTPIKLDIRIDTATTSNPDEVVELLKQSSPQDFWISEIGTTDVDHEALKKLVNTVHRVTEVGNSTVTMGYSTPSPGLRRGARAQPAAGAISQVPAAVARGVEGFTPNQQVADRDEQLAIKLKVIIQQVIQEMAEGTI